ncbi:hypothetical protein GCM10020229_33550 [Kitasatospora albolonga]
MDAAARHPGSGRWRGGTARVQERYRARPYEELLRLVRTGPGFSPFALPGVDEAANLVEYYVHAEDVRRAGPGVEAGAGRPVDGRTALEAAADAGPAGGRAAAARCCWCCGARTAGRWAVGRQGGPAVEVRGEPGELVLYAFGRGERAAVEVAGEREAMEALRVVLPFG